jgi:hypothetical protein
VTRIRVGTAAVTVGLALFAASSSQAALTFGQLGGPAQFPNGCGDGGFIVQTGVASGSDYMVPAGGGVITGWRARTWAVGNVDQILQLAVIGNDVSGDMVTFEGLSAFEHLTAVQGSSISYSFTTRIPVNGGERIGLYAKDVPPAEAFSWGCAISNGNGPADRDIWGNLSAAVIGAPPVLADEGQYLSQRVPVEATLEADADNDDFGDETQDQCPTEASTQGPCPVPPVPDTAITGGPRAKTKSKVATFQFSSPTSDATFECQLDGGAFQPCSPPHLVRVGKGRHAFAVRATAKGQTDASPATYQWKVKKKKRRHRR